MPTRDEIVAEARRWLETPWRHQARAEDGGAFIDCAGLVEAVGHATGCGDYRGPRDYRRESDGLRFLRHFSAGGCREISVRDIRPGDILIFKVPGSVYPRHCGIMTEKAGRPHFVHAYAPRPWRRVVEFALDKYWQSALVGAWRFPNVEDPAP